MKYAFTLIAVLLTASLPLQATHLRAADIVVKKVDCSSLRYDITLRVYVNTSSNTPVGGFSPDDGHISFGDGTIVIVPHAQVTRRPDLGPGIGIAEVSFTHTYVREGTYKINYFERDRSSGIVNIAESFDVPYSTYVQIKAIAGSCNTFPALAVAPLDRACRGVTFFHNAGATDSDGDSISYALTTPARNSADFVDGYVQPDAPRFYTDYEHANEAGSGRPVFVINMETGLITWDAPGVQGEYNIAFKILEWRRNPDTGEFFLLSETVRDMQIVVEDCANQRPKLTVPVNLCVEAGSVINRRISGMDPDGHPVKIEVFSAIMDGPPENFPATVTPQMTSFESSPVNIDFSWSTQCSHVREQFYQIVFKITDLPPSGPSLVTFETWNIKVIAPPPVWRGVTPDLVFRVANLEWEPYACNNAEKIQVWRKAGSTPIPSDQCTAGLSVYRGYELIAELNPDETTFRDTNSGRRLAVAAQYCYRLVAVFRDPSGGKSYVSHEYCMEPIRADAPVITHVSVMDTHPKNGTVLVRWLPPFEISKEQYPEPYEYEIYRNELSGGSDAAVNVSGRLANLAVTEFYDHDINSMDSVFAYRVVLYSRTADNETFHAIDTSAMASVVRLHFEPGDGQISLSWHADVPWSNVASQDPWHLIYRGVYGDNQEQFVLIDSTNVTETGFTYHDKGTAELALADDVRYCYTIVTKGTYGNSSIPLQLNYSQTSCSYPDSDLPPCKPVLSVEKTDCESLLMTRSCDLPEFENTLTWTFPSTEGCRTDILYYTVLVKEEGHDPIILQDKILSTTFTDNTLTSFSRCYVIQAVGHDGQPGEFSEPDCNENCPSFTLPNVFTPNGDGCNDFFGTFNPDAAEPPNPDCPTVLTTCPTFVQQVSFRVFNRWGREVYHFRSRTPDSIHIRWNGKDSDGRSLESGVYFYTADVTFDVRDPTARIQEYKGWIQIID